MADYRVDEQTGAVIFKNTAGRQKAQQKERDMKQIKHDLQILKTQNTLLLDILKNAGILTDEQFDSIYQYESKEVL